MLLPHAINLLHWITVDHGSPFVNDSYLKGLVPSFNECVDRFLERLRPLADGKTEVPMMEEFATLTLDVICKVCICTQSLAHPVHTRYTWNIHMWSMLFSLLWNPSFYVRDIRCIISCDHGCRHSSATGTRFQVSHKKVNPVQVDSTSEHTVWVQNQS